MSDNTHLPTPDKNPSKKSHIHKKFLIGGGILLAVLCACIVIFIVLPGFTTNEYVGYYEYPEAEESWGTTLRIKQYRIPEDTLEQMTDEQLAQAVADFPMLSEIAMTESPSESLESISDAYSTLLSRENGMEALIAKTTELLENEEYTKAELLTLLIEDAMGAEDGNIELQYM